MDRPHAACISAPRPFWRRSVHTAFSFTLPQDDSPTPSERTELLLSHLDTVYALALTLTGDDAEQAASLTENVYASARDALGATLGGQSLRDRLLGECVAAFTAAAAPKRGEGAAPTPVVEERPALVTLLLALPWRQRAAIALVDHHGLSYAAAATVLGVATAEFRNLLHGGRRVLFDAYRAADGHASATNLRRQSPD